jgi:hypothetical protein
MRQERYSGDGAPLRMCPCLKLEQPQERVLPRLRLDEITTRCSPQSQRQSQQACPRQFTPAPFRTVRRPNFCPASSSLSRLSPIASPSLNRFLANFFRRDGLWQNRPAAARREESAGRFFPTRPGSRRDTLKQARQENSCLLNSLLSLFRPRSLHTPAGVALFAPVAALFAFRLQRELRFS